MSKLRRGALVIGVLAGIALVVSSAVPAFAGGRVFFGVGLGFPFFYPYPYPYPPYAYPAYAPPVVVQTAPPVYVQPEPAPPSQPQYWYYCPTSQTYYPYVQDCPAGWLQVVPQVSPPAPAPR
jgi:hypothetical protein